MGPDFGVAAWPTDTGSRMRKKGRRVDNLPQGKGGAMMKFEHLRRGVLEASFAEWLEEVVGVLSFHDGKTTGVADNLLCFF